MIRTTQKLRCAATTGHGKPCSNWAMHGADRCASHLGRVGRKLRLDEAMTAQLEAILRAGNYLDVACHAVGIKRRLFDEWMQKGREGHAAFTDFAVRMDKARATGEVRNVAVIASAATDSWQAAAWLLERTAPERWARVSQRELAMPTPPADVTKADDPFAEADELAARRRTA
jgi:hypothetical protein